MRCVVHPGWPGRWSPFQICVVPFGAWCTRSVCSQLHWVLAS